MLDLSATYEVTPEEEALSKWNDADTKRRKVESIATKVCDAAPTYEAGILARMQFDSFCVAAECEVHKGAASDMLTKTLEMMRMWRDTARVVMDASQESSRAAKEVIRLKQQMVNKLEDETALLVERADGERPITPPMREFTSTLLSQRIQRDARKNKENATYHCVLLNQYEFKEITKTLRATQPPNSCDEMDATKRRLACIHTHLEEVQKNTEESAATIAVTVFTPMRHKLSFLLYSHFDVGYIPVLAEFLGYVKEASPLRVVYKGRRVDCIPTLTEASIDDGAIVFLVNSLWGGGPPNTGLENEDGAEAEDQQPTGFSTLKTWDKYLHQYGEQPRRWTLNLDLSMAIQHFKSAKRLATSGTNYVEWK